MKDKILNLRKKGKSYNEISKILNIGKSHICYYCGEGQKEKWNVRLKKNRKKVNVIIRTKIDRFLQGKLRNFKRSQHKKEFGHRYGLTKSRFNYTTAYKKIFDNPICFLTGRKLDLTKPNTYQLDHIVAVSKKGKNTLKNMGLASKDANCAKGNLSVKEFMKLCIEVCEYNGYKVTRK